MQRLLCGFLIVSRGIYLLFAVVYFCHRTHTIMYFIFCDLLSSPWPYGFKEILHGMAAHPRFPRVRYLWTGDSYSSAYKQTSRGVTLGCVTPGRGAAGIGGGGTVPRLAPDHGPAGSMGVGPFLGSRGSMDCDMVTLTSENPSRFSF